MAEDMPIFVLCLLRKPGSVQSLQTFGKYHLPKYGWNVNGTQFFGSFQRKISDGNGTPKNGSPHSVFPDEISQSEIRVPFLQSHL